MSAEPEVAGDVLHPLRVSGWSDLAGLAHGFFGRAGGVSAGPFSSLNVSDQVGDDAAAVAANWQRAARACGGLAFARMRQVHGARVVRVEDRATPIGAADGMIACADGVGLAVLTADCVPILCVAPAAHAVMVLHAGWRGTVAGIAAAGVIEAQRWRGIPPDDWQVALGPSIGGCCYEVETGIGQQLVDQWGAMPEAWQPAGLRGQLDLRAANRRILGAQGVPDSQIVDVGPCTACRSAEFFSHRRSGGRAGRQLSVIGWVERPASCSGR